MKFFPEFLRSFLPELLQNSFLEFSRAVLNIPFKLLHRIIFVFPQWIPFEDQWKISCRASPEITLAISYRVSPKKNLKSSLWSCFRNSCKHIFRVPLEIHPETHEGIGNPLFVNLRRPSIENPKGIPTWTPENGIPRKCSVKLQEKLRIEPRKKSIRNFSGNSSESLSGNPFFRSPMGFPFRISMNWLLKFLF